MTYYNFGSETPIYHTFDNLLTLEELCDFKKQFMPSDECKLEESTVYMRNTKKETVDHTLRKSKGLRFNDATSFDKIEEIIIKRINNIVKDREYNIVRNDIDVLTYESGDFFEAHNDFVTIRSNVIKNYSFLLCLEGNCDGGETILHMKENESIVLKQTITPSSAVLFRNEVLHEGSKVNSGRKVVLKINLVGVKKENTRIISKKTISEDKFKLLLTENEDYIYCHSEPLYTEMLKVSKNYPNIVPVIILSAAMGDDRSPVVIVVTYGTLAAVGHYVVGYVGSLRPNKDLHKYMNIIEKILVDNMHIADCAGIIMKMLFPCYKKDCSMMKHQNNAIQDCMMIDESFLARLYTCNTYTEWLDVLKYIVDKLLIDLDNECNYGHYEYVNKGPIHDYYTGIYGDYSTALYQTYNHIYMESNNGGRPIYIHNEKLEDYLYDEKRVIGYQSIHIESNNSEIVYDEPPPIDERVFSEDIINLTNKIFIEKEKEFEFPVFHDEKTFGCHEDSYGTIDANLYCRFYKLK